MVARQTIALFPSAKIYPGSIPNETNVRSLYKEYAPYVTSIISRIRFCVQMTSPSNSRLGRRQFCRDSGQSRLAPRFSLCGVENPITGISLE